MPTRSYFFCPICNSSLKLERDPNSKQPKDLKFGIDTIFICSGDKKHQYPVVMDGYFQVPGRHK